MSATGDLATLQEEFEREADAVDSREAWDALRIAWVGRKQGRLKDLMKRMKDIPPGGAPRLRPGRESPED